VTELLALQYPLVHVRPARHGNQAGNEGEVRVQEVVEAFAAHARKDRSRDGADPLGVPPQRLLELQKRFLAHVALQ